LLDPGVLVSAFISPKEGRARPTRGRDPRREPRCACV